MLLRVNKKFYSATSSLYGFFQVVDLRMEDLARLRIYTSTAALLYIYMYILLPEQGDSLSRL